MTWKLGGEVARGDELHRWYDAGVGRWLSQDPIGFAAGDANLYRYVGNGATNWVDPSGLQWGPSGDPFSPPWSDPVDTGYPVFDPKKGDGDLDLDGDGLPDGSGGKGGSGGIVDILKDGYKDLTEIPVCIGPIDAKLIVKPDEKGIWDALRGKGPSPIFHIGLEFKY